MEKRVIKFRVWDRIFKEYSNEPFNSVLIENENWSDIGDQYIIEQFTGLHDKGGKEIYDGDIMDGLFKREVYWDLAMGQWAIRKNKDDYNPSPLYAWTDFNVVGNIHEGIKDKK